MCIRHLKWKLPGLVLAVLLVGHGFAAARWVSPPPGQPAQIWSKVHYDPRLTDPFFKSNEWRYPWNIVKHPDGTFEDTTSDKRPEAEPPHVPVTARWFSASMGSEHPVAFCDARSLAANTMDLFIYNLGPGYHDRLRVRIRKGMFKCQCWTLFRVRSDALLGAIWTTKRQKLTLDKKIYRKGDVIKGRIDFECVQEPANAKYIQKSGRYSKTIQIYGVFRTVVK